MMYMVHVQYIGLNTLFGKFRYEILLHVGGGVEDGRGEEGCILW